MKSKTSIVKEAQRLIEGFANRSKDPTSKIDGFRTKRGLELALELERDSVFVWTEPLEELRSLSKLSPTRMYAPTDKRNCHLDCEGRTPRLSKNHSIWYWKFDNLADLSRLLSLYLTLGPGSRKASIR